MARPEQFSLSIVIPTMSPSETLDRAIVSVKQFAPANSEVVVSVNGFSLAPFRSSRFFLDGSIRWECRKAPPAPLHESLNFAVTKAKNSFIFLLSDDDEMCAGFASGLVKHGLSPNQLYATSLAVGDPESGKPFRKSGYGLLEMAPREIAHAAYHWRFHHNLSLFIFSRHLFDSTGGFVDSGYPNGYFVDTIYHLKLLARAPSVRCSSAVDVRRNLSSSQGSASFFLGPEVNGLLKHVAAEIWADLPTRSMLSAWISSFEELRRFLVRRRFRTEWSKTGMAIYGGGIRLRTVLLVQFLIHWELPPQQKLVLPFLIFFERLFSFCPRALGRFKASRPRAR